MQYSQGRSVGLLADAWRLGPQRPLPDDINPRALVVLRRQWMGKSFGLEVATSSNHRVVAPFPLTIQNGRAQRTQLRGVCEPVQ